MICSNCGSAETEFEESKTDKSVVGGKVHIWRCSDCGQVTEDVPAEVYDEIRDREMTERAGSE